MFLLYIESGFGSFYEDKKITIKEVTNEELAKKGWQDLPSNNIKGLMLNRYHHMYAGSFDNIPSIKHIVLSDDKDKHYIEWKDNTVTKIEKLDLNKVDLANYGIKVYTTPYRRFTPLDKPELKETLKM